MGKRTPFPKVFWVANSVEVLERFAYYRKKISRYVYSPFRCEIRPVFSNTRLILLASTLGIL